METQWVCTFQVRGVFESLINSSKFLVARNRERI
jgi:hypothetical protein